MTQKITIYHSPDADDAFMFYGLSCGAVGREGYEFGHELCDIQTLNERTLRGELDVTAISVHAYAYLAEPYSILSCGASLGGASYGPRLISLPGKALNEVQTVALPGELTSAALAFRLFALKSGLEFEYLNMPFDAVQGAVRSGEVDAGVLIHEGQLTIDREGFNLLSDLGVWWWGRHALPLPLGVNVVRRSLGTEAVSAVSQVLRESIQYGLSHREKALEYANKFGRGLSMSEADTFVSMYVNEWTLNLGDKGRQTIKLFLQEGYDEKILPKPVTIDFA